MLPIITVGLTPAGCAALERIPGDRGIVHYGTAEDALWAMGNDHVTGGSETPGEPIQLDADGRKWQAHVVYGDDAIGLLLAHTAMDPKPVEVPATGLIMVVTDSLGDDQHEPRRMVDGTPESREITRQAVAAVERLHAQAFLAVDRLHETPHWPQAIEHQLSRAEEQRPAVAAVDPTAAADAARQVSALNAMVRKGQHRPGHFEEKGRRS